MIEIKGLTKKVNNKTLIDNLSLKLPSRGIVVINGKSGVGKTTLLNIIALEDEKFVGTINYFGQKIDNLIEFKKDYIFYNRSEDNLVLSLSVDDNLKLFLSAEQYDRAIYFINRYDLKYLLFTKVKNISTGEYQKICLILALARKTKITILDEPVGNIDSDSIRLFYDDLMEMSITTLIIYVSHYEEDVSYIADFIYTMEDKKIVCLKEKDLFINESLVKETRNYSLKSFLRMSKYWNENFSKFKLVLFCLLFYFSLVILLFGIYLLNLKNYDFYNFEMTYSPVKTVYFNNNIGLDFSCVEKIEIKNLEDCCYYSWYYENGQYEPTLTTNMFYGYNYCDVKYMAICDSMSVKGKEHLLGVDEMIITDYIANQLQCKKMDIIEFGGNSFIVKDIIETNYIEYINNQKHLDEYDYYYNIIYVSKDYVDYKSNLIANYSFDSDTSIYGIPCRIINYDIINIQNNNQIVTFYSDTLTQPLGDNGFYCGMAFFETFLEKLPGYETDDYDLSLDYLYSCIGKTFEISFDLGKYKFRKEMVFKGPIVQSGNIVINGEIYNRIREEIGLNDLDYCYKTAIYSNTVDKTDSSYDDFIRTLETRDDYTFVNKKSFDNYYNLFIVKNRYILWLILVEIFLLILLIIIYYFSIFKLEFKEYKKLQSKGYSRKYFFAINYTYRIIIHAIIISFISIGFILLMSTLI